MPDKKSPNPALTKAFEKAEGDGPIETTLELTEAQIKKLIRAADRVILDAADTAKKVPGAIVDAAKTVVGAGIDGAKSAGKSWLGAIKALGSFVGTDFAPGTLMGPKPKGDTSPPSMAPYPRPKKEPFPPYVNPDRIATAVPKEEMPKKPLPRKKSPTVNPDRIDNAKPKSKYSNIDKYF
jgi:hypothetical protein